MLTPFIDDTILHIELPSEYYRRLCMERWNSLCKPIHGLGRLEDMTAQIGAIQRTENPRIDETAIVIMGADNGVVCEGVSQCGSGVTSQVLLSMAEKRSSVCLMSQFRKAEVIPVDIGLNKPLKDPRVLSRAVRRGTGNIRKEPAMSRREALAAIEEGIRLAGEMKKKGFRLLIPGEMGIGNTTTSAACVCAYFGKDPSEIAGRGAGLPAEGVVRKAAVIRDALRENHPDSRDTIDVLSRVGGLDIAGMTGLFIGAAGEQLPAVIDGLIAALSAYIACRLSEKVRGYLIPSHAGTEPGDRILLDAIGLQPALCLDMHLGEGTGAACLLPLLDEALYLYRNLPVFSENGIKAYRPYN